MADDLIHPSSGIESTKAARILIVDDDVSMLEALSSMVGLRLKNMGVDTCPSAMAALERIATTDYDAIVSDIKMPQMDGLTLMERVLTLRPTTPTLLVTGHGDHDLGVRALNSGAYAFIQKPIDRDYFIAWLRRAIQLRQLSRTVERQNEVLERTVQERTAEMERTNQDLKEILQEQREGWEAITEADVQRLKWYGLFLRQPTPGFFMIRVRIPGGRTDAAQLGALAGIAAKYGNGLLDLTTRQQIQLRQIRIEHVPAIFHEMDAAGLTSLQTGMDNVRNVMTCPVAGLSPDEIVDTTSLVTALTRALTGSRAFSNLPRKFNLAVTGCPDNCLHTETQDLALVPSKRVEEGGVTVGFNVLAGGKLGSGGYRIATSLDVFVTPSEAVPVCRAIVEVFRDHGCRESRTTARLAFLLDEWGEDRFRKVLQDRVGWPLARAGADGRKTAARDHVGIYRQAQAGLNYAGLKVTVGRITADDLTAMTVLAERYGTGHLRLSPAQGIIIPNVPDRKVGDLTEEPIIKRFSYNPSAIRHGLVSCVGNDYCNLAVIETKSRAVQTAAALESRLGRERNDGGAGPGRPEYDQLKPITMHWSGCPAGCGNHLVADIGLLGKKVKIKGQVVDAVDVYVGGRSGPDPKLAVKLLEDVPCDQLASILEGVIPYHSREKMHRVRAHAARKTRKSEPETTVAIAFHPTPILGP